MIAIVHGMVVHIRPTSTICHIILDPPPHIPKEDATQNVSKIVWFRRLLGKILLYSILLIITLHIAHLFVIGVIMVFAVAACGCLPEGEQDEDAVSDYPITSMIVYFVMFIGLAVAPVMIVCIILFHTDIYSEVQSWMIAYITWGAITFILIYIFIIALFGVKDKKKSDKLTKINTNIILYIVGVDLGKIDIRDKIENSDVLEVVKGKDMALAVLMMIPPCAALLPSAIAGFLANYVLEEKFELKCKDDFVNEDICFDTSYGCCEVVSSHNWRNMYSFMGALASNILASWAVIRIAGYLLVNAYPNFSVHANRRIVK